MTKAKAPEKSEAMIGGKGAKLHWLVDLGLRVPEFFCIPKNAYLNWLQNGTLDPATNQTLQVELGKLPGEWFAIRSSATTEDGVTDSFAGILDTFLFVPRSKVSETVLRCFEATQSDRVAAYLKAKSPSGGPRLELAVVIQSMLNPFCSGVAFSRTPNADNSSSALILIEGGYGLGEGVVSGLVTVDRFSLDRLGREVEVKIGQKTQALRMKPGNEGGTEMQEVPAQLSELPILEAKHLQELTSAVVKIETALGSPVDVEWAYVDDQLHLLQARPITQPFPKLHTFIDTNLTESYPGWTSRLTRTFVPAMYTQVFTQTMRLMGYSTQRIRESSSLLNSLLSDHFGHLYYHLDCYYPILCLLPGGNRNLDAWHRMIGGNRQVTSAIQLARPLTWVERTRIGLKLLWILITRKFRAARFERQALARVEGLRKNLISADTEESPPLPLEEQARKLVKSFIHEVDATNDWGFPILNDVFVMRGLATVEGLLKSHHLPPSLLGSLIRTRTGVDSLKPLALLEDLLRDNQSHLCIKQLATEGKQGQSRLHGDQWKSALQGPRAAMVKGAIEDFLELYGDRAFEELKLECPTFRQEPLMLSELLSWMQPRESKAEPEAASLDSDAEALRALSKFSLKDRLPMKWARSFTQGAVHTREAARLMRGQYYGWVRQVALKLGDLLVEAFPGQLDSPKAVFLLSYPTLRKFAVDPSLKLADLLNEVVNERGKPENDPHHPVAYPEFYWAPASLQKGEVPYFARPKLEAISQPSAAGDFWLGVGASAGVRTGKALVIEKPLDALNYTDIEERILVTKTTDPAWIFLMSRCKGLISEKGSLLSHTAIVGRELGIPTVVGVDRITRNLRTDEMIQLDGAKGSVVRIDSPSPGDSNS